MQNIEENIGEKSLSMRQQTDSQYTKTINHENNQHIVFHQNLKVCSSKNIVKKIKWQATDGDKIFTTHISDKILYLEYIKNANNTIIT